MPPNEQADLWMSLRDRMRGSWGDLTVQEKKACRLLLYRHQIGLAKPLR